MKTEYNIYCDESCHLLNDQNRAFVLGAIWVNKGEVAGISEAIRELKRFHKLSARFEAKWTKVSRGKVDFYCDLVRLFFSSQALHFRAVVVPDKTILDHSAFAQDHNTWYYKMFYVLLNVILKENSEYNLYLDIKDTKSNSRVLELKRILNITSNEDAAINKAQQIRSYEIELVQMVDILIGALSYAHRGLASNEGKNKVIEAIKSSIGDKILTSSSKEEEKFNVLVWKPRTH